MSKLNKYLNISEKELTNKIIYVYENLLNAYYDYCYLNRIIKSTNYKTKDLTNSWDYILCIKHYFEVIKRDYFNCIYKMLIDNKSFTFKDIKIIMKSKYNLDTGNYTEIDKIQERNMQLLRNNYLSHNGNVELNVEIDLDMLSNQLNALITTYNDMANNTELKLKTIDENELQKIQNEVNCGISKLFNNEEHKKIYGETNE